MTHFLRPFVKPIKYIPIFSGTSNNGEKIVLYQRIGNESELYLKRGNHKLLLLNPETEVMMFFDSIEAKMSVTVSSEKWTGTAKGTRKELIKEKGIR